MEKSFVYSAQLLETKDGDTCDFLLSKTIETELDFGFKIKQKTVNTQTFEITTRFYGINAPETHTKNLVEKAKGLAATEHLKQILDLGTITIESEKAGKELSTEKFGRYLAKIKVTTPSGEIIDVNQRMVDLGFAVPYFGGKR